MTLPATPLTIGLHYNVPFAAYAADTAVNASLLKHMGECPAACRHARDNPRPDTADFLLGRAVHALALEGEEAFTAAFAVAPDVDRRTKAGKLSWLNFEAQCQGKSILTVEQAAQARCMAGALAQHPLASRLLALPGASEVTAVWVDAESGLKCKARADRLCNLPDGTLAVLDVKTCSSASPPAFSSAIASYGYHVQAGFYLWGLQSLGEPYRNFAFLCVEKSPPFLVAVYQLRQEDHDAGADVARRYLSQYSRCDRENHWPGYGYDAQSQSYLIEPVSRPAWARNRERDLDGGFYAA